MILQLNLARRLIPDGHGERHKELLHLGLRHLSRLHRHRREFLRHLHDPHDGAPLDAALLQGLCFVGGSIVARVLFEVHWSSLVNLSLQICRVSGRQEI